MNCLDTFVAQVIEQGWCHHITRLMVLSNLATLCGFSPRELCVWFWFAYVDAYDWVVKPNVLGMGTYADAGLTATKPYVSGAAYINRMSDYCRGCQDDPTKIIGAGSCPFTRSTGPFWCSIATLWGATCGYSMAYGTLDKKDAAERKQLRERARQAIEKLNAAPHPGY
jgi:deoxyribodipyrimidine photolyase-related protein